MVLILFLMARCVNFLCVFLGLEASRVTVRNVYSVWTLLRIIQYTAQNHPNNQNGGNSIEEEGRHLY
jgi:hypothetical protein